ncbi:MAG TPA: DUF2007 domain-containing protein [Verrucomicrobiae bacterium]
MKLITIFSSFNQMEIQEIRARLETAGFHPFVANEIAPMILAGYSKSALIRVEVPEVEVDEVRQFLAAPAEA